MANMSIKRFKFLAAKNLVALEKQIEAHAKKGWNPYGDLKILNNEYIHAMVIYAKSR